MRLALKSIKVFEPMSEETNCYNATLWVEGKPTFFVSNRGHGGCDDIHSALKDKPGWNDVKGLHDLVQDYLGALPESDNGFGGTMKQDIETFCGDAVTEFLIKKDLRKLLKQKTVVLTKDCELLGGPKKDTWPLSHVASGGKILNDLKFDEAMVIYRKYA